MNTADISRDKVALFFQQAHIWEDEELRLLGQNIAILRQQKAELQKNKGDNQKQAKITAIDRAIGDIQEEYKAKLKEKAELRKIEQRQNRLRRIAEQKKHSMNSRIQRQTDRAGTRFSLLIQDAKLTDDRPLTFVMPALSLMPCLFFGHGRHTLATQQINANTPQHFPTWQEIKTKAEGTERRPKELVILFGMKPNKKNRQYMTNQLRLHAQKTGQRGIYLISDQRENTNPKTSYIADFTPAGVWAKMLREKQEKENKQREQRLPMVITQ